MPLHATDLPAWFQRGKGGRATAVSFCVVPKWATICAPALPWDFPQQVYPLLGSLDWLWLTPVVWMIDTCHVDYNMARLFFSHFLFFHVWQWTMATVSLPSTRLTVTLSYQDSLRKSCLNFQSYAHSFSSLQCPPPSAVLHTVFKQLSCTVTDHLQHQHRKGTVSVSLGFRCLV